jgi:hypothetical protein
MEGKGVTLCFYNFMQGQSLIARCLRYMRAESSSFTAADVSLGKFTVL